MTGRGGRVLIWTFLVRRTGVGNGFAFADRINHIYRMERLLRAAK